MARFSTKVLDKALKERLDLTEALRKKLLKKTLSLLTALSVSYKFEEAYIFGSLAEEERFTEDSDIDIGFIGLKSEDVLKISTFLSNALERNVDVLQLEKTRFEKKAKGGVKWKKTN